MSDCFRKIESGGTASTRIYELIELTLKVSIDKKDKIEGAFFINDFKPSSVKSVDLEFRAEIGRAHV